MTNYEDDASIDDNDGLLRRILNRPIMLKFDENLNIIRPSSACFTDRGDGQELSVTLERPLLDSGMKHTDAIAGNAGFGLARLCAGFVRHNLKPAQAIVREPTSEDPFHALIAGKKEKKAAKKMALAATILIQPTIEKPTASDIE